MHTPAGQDIIWMLRELSENAVGVAHVVVLSADGLPMIASPGLAAERAELLAAMAAGLISLTAGAADLLETGAVKQCVVEMAQGYFIVMTISDGSCLAVLAAAGADVGLIGYQMARLTTRLGAHLTPALRRELTRAPM